MRSKLSSKTVMWSWCVIETSPLTAVAAAGPVRSDCSTAEEENCHHRGCCVTTVVAAEWGCGQHPELRQPIVAALIVCLDTEAPSRLGRTVRRGTPDGRRRSPRVPTVCLSEACVEPERAAARELRLLNLADLLAIAACSLVDPPSASLHPR